MYRDAAIALLHNANLQAVYHCCLYKFSPKHSPIKTRPQPLTDQSGEQPNILRQPCCIKLASRYTARCGLTDILHSRIESVAHQNQVNITIIYLCFKSVIVVRNAVAHVHIGWNQL